MRKYVESSTGQRTPLGTYTNDPSENTALFNAAKKLSLYGTTEPRYFSTRSGCSRRAARNDEKVMPYFESASLIVVPTDPESKIASTATMREEHSKYGIIFCSFS